VLLQKAKAEVGHNRFGDWVRNNCQFSHSSADGYMRIATEWDTIDANSQQIANYGLAAVLRWLSQRNAKEALHPTEGSLRGHSPEVVAQYRRLLTWCENSLQPGRPETKYFDVLPSLDREELECTRERLLSLGQRVQELVGKIDREISGEAAAQESARVDATWKQFIEDGGPDFMKGEGLPPHDLSPNESASSSFSLLIGPTCEAH
jgi:hypothetical protein